LRKTRSASRSRAEKRPPTRGEKRRHRRRVTLITALALLLLGLSFPLWAKPLGRVLAAQIVSASRHYRVTSVTVAGNRALSQEQILALAKVPAGAALLSVPVRQVRQRLEGHPWIRYAYVRRRLPDTIEIRVTEREPVAAVRGGGLFMITADSMAVAPLTDNWLWDLPILTPSRALTLRDGVAVRDSSTLALLHEVLVLRAVSTDAWKNLSEMYYAGGQIHATLSQPPLELNLGRGASELAWTSALHLLTARPAGELARCQSMDLRIPGKIVVSMSTPVATERTNG
jgi:hypothetical protein